MCFGNQTTGTKDTTSTPNPLTSSLAAQNTSFVENLQNQGFTPYSGNQVANFGPLQSQSFGIANAIGANGVSGVPQANDYINNYGSAPASSVSANTISSAMSPYMNQYVQQALAPQLQLQQQQFDQQNRASDSAAVGAGAYGNDSQAALAKSNTSLMQDTSRQGLIGNAYNAAFNTAIGAGAQDVSNNLNAQTTNANLNEQMLGRQMGAATGLENLGSYQTNTGINQANLLNTYGAQQTAQGQAGLNASYNQWLMAQQYPFQTAQLANQTLGANATALPASTTSTTSAPDNSGLNAVGSIGTAFMLSDVRAKDNIEPVGHLLDGSNVYTFTYKGDPTVRMGLMAQEVEQVNPGAVVTLPGGLKAVDYKKATAPSRGLAAAFALAA